MLLLAVAGALGAPTEPGEAAPGVGASAQHARSLEGKPTKPRISVLGRNQPHARNTTNHARQARPVGALGEMPAPARQGGKQSKTTTLSPRTAAAPSAMLASQPGASFDGFYSTPGAYDPPDANGDVGLDYYVEAINQDWAVFDKAGNLIDGPFPLSGLWSKSYDDVCSFSPQGDPTIVYDRLAHRWVLTFMAFPVDQFGNGRYPFVQCVATSLSDDPLGYWWIYSFDMSAVGGMLDYPKMGIWSDGYYMSANLFPTNPNYPGTEPNPFLPVQSVMVTFEKNAIMDGQYARWRAYIADSAEAPGGILPANYEGDAADAPAVGTPNPFVSPDPNTFSVRVYQYSGNWGGNAVDPVQRLVPVAPYDPLVCTDTLGRCIGQPGTTIKLPGTDRDQYMYRSTYRKVGGVDHLVFNQTVNAGSNVAGVHWYELRGITGSSPTEFAEGTLHPDSVHRWLGSSSMDKAGNMGLVYNASDATSVKPGIRYAGRTSGQPSGQAASLDVTESTLIAGSGVKTGTFPPNDVNGTPRWGDYGSLSTDPIDNCTFWMTGEYLPASTDYGWTTRVGTFRIPAGACGSVNKQPLAAFTVNGVGAGNQATTTVGQSVSFDGSASSDPDGTISNYGWDFDSDGTSDANSASSSTTHTYNLPGRYVATLRVTDSGGANAQTNETTRTLVVNPVNNTPPNPDNRATPQALGAKTQLSNINATVTGEAVHTCGSPPGSNYGKTVWLSYHASTAGTLTLNSSGIDTVMALYPGSASTPLTCNDDDAKQAPGPSHITRRVPAGDYEIQIGGFDNGTNDGGFSGVITVASAFDPNVAPTAAFSASPGTAIAHHAVTFDGGSSSDSDGNVARYEWDLDGNGTFETDGGGNNTTVKTYDAPGTVTVGLRVTDNESDSATTTRPLTIVAPAPPAAKFTASPNPALVGTAVTFDGSGSADASHVITNYEWDLDGDGTFERSTGGAATTTNSYSAANTYHVGLRVTDSDGLQGTTAVDVKVNAAPTVSGLFGVTVNNGAQYTRSVDVDVSSTFPSSTTEMLFSNDGGFLNPTTFKPQKDTNWKLDSSGPERLPKTIYVRFRTGPLLSETYQDDIILDETPPKVEQATIAPAAGAARIARLSKYSLKVKATDSNSGVSKLQVTRDKRKPGKELAYKRKLSVKSPARPKFIRARDRAGNWSRWRKIR